MACKVKLPVIHLLLNLKSK